MTETKAQAPAELSEADFRGCRWIENEPVPLRRGMFCGAPTFRGSWCARHHKVVWNYKRGGRVRPVLAQERRTPQ